MLDGMTVETFDYKNHGVPIFSKHEWMFDVEKQSIYYPDCCLDVIITYRNPRNTEEIRKVRVHRNVTQFENFLWCQLDLDEIERRELDRLQEFIGMKPTLIYWDLVLGFYHSAGWKSIFEKKNISLEVIDSSVLRSKVYLGIYRWKNLVIKIYRINPENNPKYGRGLLGLTKAEIVTPVLYLSRDGKDERVLISIVKMQQKIRRFIVDDFWNDMQLTMARKLIARDPWIHPWRGNDADLKGAMLIGETELTKRETSTPRKYKAILRETIKDLLGNEKP